MFQAVITAFNNREIQALKFKRSAAATQFAAIINSQLKTFHPLPAPAPTPCNN